jgi:hypothetical protein
MHLKIKLIAFIIFGFHTLEAQTISIKIGIGLFKSTTNLQAQQERGNVFSGFGSIPVSFDFMGQQKFTIVQPRYFPITGISIPIWIEYYSKRKISYRAGVVIGEYVGLGYQRIPNYNTAFSNTNVPQFYVGADGISYGSFVTRFPFHVNFNGLNLISNNPNKAIIISPTIGLELMSIIKASNNGVFSDPEEFFIVDANGNLKYYNTYFAMTNYKTKKLRQLNVFGSVGLSLRYFKKNKEICEILFTYRHNLNPDAVPFQFTLKIEDPNNLIPYKYPVYNYYNHQGNAYSLSLNFPIRLKFLERRFIKETSN